MKQDCPIIIFAKAPVPGFAKTRLARAIGYEAAARLAERMLADTLAHALAADVGPVELCCAPDAAHPRFIDAAREPGVSLSEQGNGDLGQRMHRALSRRLAEYQRALLIGTDCPALGPELLRAAASALDTHAAVFGPAFDGGYVLVGLRQPQPSLFTDMAWSTGHVMRETRVRLQALNLKTFEMAPLRDIDEPQDLIHVPAEWLA